MGVRDCLFPKRKKRWNWLDASWLERVSGLSDSRGGWRRYSDRLRLCIDIDAKELERLEKRMNRGWCIGSEGFKQDLVREYFQNRGAMHMKHAELREFNESRWQILRSALKALAKEKQDLKSSRKSESWKLAIAVKMKQETSVTNRWLSEQLHMGTPNGVSSICGKYERESQHSCQHAKRLRKLRIEQ